MTSLYPGHTIAVTSRTSFIGLVSVFQLALLKIHLRFPSLSTNLFKRIRMYKLGREHNMRASLLLFLFSAAFCVAFVASKKSKSTFKTFGPRVESQHACEICRTMVYQAYDVAQEIHANATKRGVPVREEQILSEITEKVCNPYVTVGQWLRLIDITIDSKRNISHLSSLPRYTKCKRKCTTLANTCTTIVDSEAADHLPALLLKGEFVTPESIEDAVCSDICTSTASARYRKLSDKDLQDIQREASEEIDSKELDIEALMDDMERSRGGPSGTPPVDVFSRDEMLNVQDAILAGDLEKLRELDPTADDLTEEDLIYLRQMYEGDRTGQSMENLPEDV